MTDHPTKTDTMLSTPQAATYLGTSAQTLYRWRTAGTGPPYYRNPVNRRIYYRKEDLDAWLQESALVRTDPLDAVRSFLRGQTL